MIKEFVTRGKHVSSNVKIWRYMNFTKFISLIYKKALFFPRADNLGDPFEGSFPKINVEKRKNATKYGNPKIEILSEHYKKFVKCTAINSWHINEEESDSMWKLYIKDGEGIAIQSTVVRLKSSMQNYKKYNVSCGMVAYVNYDEERIPDDTLAPYFHKRKEFQHEEEYRAIIQQIKYKKDNEIDFKKSTLKGGVYVNVNLEQLIENVYIAPTCPIWQKKLAQSLLNRVKLKRTVRKSNLNGTPQY